MTPTQFLSLASDAPLNNLKPTQEIHDSGKPMAYPFLRVRWMEDDNMWKVADHEGRHRVGYFRELFGDVPITVDIFPIGIRRQYIKPEQVAKDVQIQAQHDAKDSSISYDVADFAKQSFFDFEVSQEIKRKEPEDEKPKDDDKEMDAEKLAKYRETKR